MRMTSGSCRSTRRSASANDAVSAPISRWWMSDLLALVVELDRVFDRDDVRRQRVVDDVDHRRERRRLARAGRARQQHEPARLEREVVGDRRRAELLEREDALGDEAQRDGDRAELAEHVDAEPPEPFRRMREVDLVTLLELVALARRHQPERRGLDPQRRQRLGDSPGSARGRRRRA